MPALIPSLTRATCHLQPMGCFVVLRYEKAVNISINYQISLLSVCRGAVFSKERQPGLERGAVCLNAFLLVLHCFLTGRPGETPSQGGPSLVDDSLHERGHTRDLSLLSSLVTVMLQLTAVTFVKQILCRSEMSEL